ncbi:MAG: hypothetical protein BGO98_26920 [Myxococcales bacterium 68-20]|nr:MAG: hypothetical protein BGO98_26920 [Myxococcales bacterium 68-20]
MKLLLAAFAASAAALWPRNVAAQPTVTHAHAVVNAACADEDGFWKRVGAYTSLVAKASADEGTVTLVVTVHAEDERTTGSFAVLDGANTAASYERSVSGTSCEEVLDALSFFVALTYDPDLLGARPHSTPAPLPPERPRVAPPPAKRSWILALGAAAELTATGDIPLGGSVFAQASRRFGRIEPAFRISLSALTTRVETSNVSARFVWLSAAPEVCVSRFAAGVLSISPCGSFVLGVSSATPSGVPGGRSFIQPWLAPRVLVRGAMTLDRRLSIELSCGVETPLLRGRYLFGPIPAYRTPAIAPFVMLGLSLAIGSG